jgi:hypothetical protein
MRPALASGLAGLGWVAAIAVLGLAVPSPMGRLAILAIVTLIAGILAFVAKMPSRVGRIVVAMGSLICVAVSFPDAAREAQRYTHRDRATLSTTPSQLPAKSETRK